MAPGFFIYKLGLLNIQIIKYPEFGISTNGKLSARADMLVYHINYTFTTRAWIDNNDIWSC